MVQTRTWRGRSSLDALRELPERGLILLSCLLMLAFLSMVGAALLSTASVDLVIANHYSTGVRLRYLAEGAAEEAREVLRVSEVPLAVQLARSAGPDGRLEASNRIEELLASDDEPVIPSDPALRFTGLAEPVNFGRGAAAAHVFLRNDIADGPASSDDTNGVVTLVAVATLGDRRDRVEIDLERSGFPVVAALTFAGTAEMAVHAEPGAFRISGGDRCGGVSVHAVGFMAEDPVMSFTAQIPPGFQTDFTGVGPVPDVSDVGGIVPGMMESPERLEWAIAAMRTLATEVHDPDAFPARVGAAGSWENPGIVVVEGDAVLGPGVGHGILIVRGAARVEDGFVWNGLVLVVGAGILDWSGAGTVNGGVFVAHTLPGAGSEGAAADSSGPGRSRADFSGASGGIYYDACVLESVLRRGPLSVVEVRSY